MAVKVPPLLHKMSASAQKAWYKKHGMEMPAKEKSAATAGKMKPAAAKKAEPVAADKPKTAREISMERQKAYYAKGGRQPIGAGGSGGHSSMAGVGQSSAKEIIKGIRAGINPKSRGIGEEVSPMIKPPTNRFDKKSDAFAHVEKHGGKVYKQTYTDSKGQQTVSYSVKKEEVELDEGKMKDIVTDRQETERLEKDLPFTPDKNKVRRGSGGAMSQAKWLAKQAMMKKMKSMGMKEEAIVEVADADKGEYDYEGDMAKSQLKSIITNAQRLHDMLEDNTNLPEWVQSKITLAEDYVLTAASYMEGKMNEEALTELAASLDEEIELFEKAPPGSKYERMVKHIKKGYAKGGLTPKEKSIAYATAWKAYKKNEEVEQIDELKKSTLASYVNKAANQVRAKSGIAASFETQGARKRNPENKTAYWDVAQDYRKGARKRLTGIEKATSKLAKEEVEQVTEAEGTVAVTPKEKALAAHHGDPKKITYGDVIKARLKSVAAKKMGK
jgi:hypothetical protein